MVWFSKSVFLFILIIDEVIFKNNHCLFLMCDKMSKEIRQDSYILRLKQIVFNQPALMQRLIYLRQMNTEAYLSAGVIRNLVWSFLHEQHYKIEDTEIDVIFYDLADPHAEQQRLTRLLQHQFPENEWDVVNQAFVHTWYKTDQGQSITQYSSLLDALSVWVETATAIAVRFLEKWQKLHIVETEEE